MSARAQNLLILLGIVLIGALGYYLYTTNQSTLLQSGSINGQASVDSAALVQRLNEIKAVTFDTSLFSDARFSRLQNFSRPINPSAIGKQNPFE